MSKLEELRDRIIKSFGINKYNVGICINPEGNHLMAIYKSHSVCIITDWYDLDGTYYIVFADNFVSEPYLPLTKRCMCVESIKNYIEQRIEYYNNKKEKEVKNMAKRHFIVEKMEVEQKCGEPDVINMTVRQEPDGIPFRTGRELKTLIESLDTDKRSIFHDDALLSTVYAISARENGKTRYIPSPIVPDQLKSGTFIFNGIKDVIFNNPATIVFWTDGSKTVVKCQNEETFDPEKGLAMAISKRVLGNDYGYYETFAKYVGRYNKKHKEK